MPRSSHPIETNVPPVAGDNWKAPPQMQAQSAQESADYGAWLREYRRWTQSGCCASSRLGDIEWGGEDCDLPKRKA